MRRADSSFWLFRSPVGIAKPNRKSFGKIPKRITTLKLELLARGRSLRLEAGVHAIR
jgi:hypothetical protein